MVFMQMANQLLGRFEEEDEQFFKSIVTTDETWVTISFLSHDSQQESGTIAVLQNPKIQEGQSLLEK